MPETWSFHAAGHLLFGPGAVEQIGPLAARWQARRILIVSDPVLARAGFVDGLTDRLRSSTCAVEVSLNGAPEPSYEAVDRCLGVARRFAPDTLLGLGGGSNMDLAKMTATLLAHGGGPADYLGEDRIPGPVLPLICVPTTAGTGSEVSGATILTDRVRELKVGVLSNYLRPRLAVVDPLLTRSCPPKVTADSGIDALTHAIEAFTAIDNEAFSIPAGEVSLYQGRHPLGDCLAEKAISLIGGHLRTAVHEGSNLPARTAMALGATLAGMAFSNVGVALVHAMEYPVGGATHCSHGAGNGLLLPHVMRFNLPVRQARFALIARLLGANTEGMTERAAAERALSIIEQLQKDIGIPTRLRDLGVKREQLQGFAEKALSIKRIVRVNPRVPTPEEVHEIFEAAF
jgi:alcohol dehydrogenase class IV